MFERKIQIEYQWYTILHDFLTIFFMVHDFWNLVAEIQWRQKFYPAVTWNTQLIDISVPSYSRVTLLPPLYLIRLKNAASIKPKMTSSFQNLVRKFFSLV